MPRLRNVPIKVRAYAGYKNPEQPRSLEMEGSVFRVASIEKEWKEIDSTDDNILPTNCYRLRLENDEVVTVFYRESDQSWFLKR